MHGEQVFSVNVGFRARGEVRQMTNVGGGCNEWRQTDALSLAAGEIKVRNWSIAVRPLSSVYREKASGRSTQL